MVPLGHLWLPIIVSAVGVFVASSFVHMVLKFWHTPDYRGLANEEEVGAAIRNGNPAPGMYLVPSCHMEEMIKARGPREIRTRPRGLPHSAFERRA